VGTKGDDSLDILETASRRIDQWISVLMSRINGLINRTKIAAAGESGHVGVVKPDGTSIEIDGNGMISAVGGGGGGDRSKVNLSSQCDGTKLVFTGTFPRPSTAMVFLNGLCLGEGVNYSITDTTLTLTTTVPEVGSVLIVELF
jgi:hypothetical protein